ncbi:amidase [Pseudoruegeria sp. SK021]|uniref:amidase n=1 Tax=Pseudoruegeria sp. SK021 TaxID=1933035 RepID=UPI000A24E615|nr:amidase [Pseudoruegeria sp. SK021]OSP55958.1 glutamyl-tRNA amidotransferase [Pseudoruegeria sp. SK021]
MKLSQFDATGLAALFSQGTATPTEALEQVEQDIARLDPKLGCYSARNPMAKAEAAAATERWRNGVTRGPLDGVPIILKDNLVAAGMPAAWGNRTLASRRCHVDEGPVGRLRAAGLVVLGKGNTPEFAVEGYTDNLTFGPTRNPFDARLTPGGSSGGVVAAVASGLAWAGLGTDGGGSIRRPAGYCGLVGLKPGKGRVPRSGGLAQVLLDFEDVGPIARSMRDVASLDSILSGHPVRSGAGGPLRVLLVPRMGDAPCDPEILTALKAAADALVDLGHDVTEAAFPLNLTELNRAWPRIAEIGLARYFADEPDVAATAAPKYQEMAARGASAPATELYRILDQIAELRAAAPHLFATCDVIMTPTAAAMPWNATESYPRQINGLAVGPRGSAVYTGWVNAAGLPALAIPAPSDGLPIGVQLVGPMDSEARLMTLGASLERRFGGFRWPDLTGADAPLALSSASQCVGS